MDQLWTANRDYVRVILKDVQTEAQLGLHAWERHPERPTRLVVNVEMFAHDAAFIDYDPVRSAIRSWPARPHTDLLETLAEELATLCFADAHVQACRVSVMKPDIFNEVGAAGVEFYRVRNPQGAQTRHA